MEFSKNYCFIPAAVTTLIFYIGSTTSAVCADPTAGEAIAHYHATLSSLESVIFTSTWVERSSGKGSTQEAKADWRIDLKNRRLWSRCRTSFFDPTNKGSPVAISIDERILSADRIDEISINEKTETANRFASYLKVPTEYWATHSRLGYTSVPIGYILHDSRYEFIPGLLDDHVIARNSGGECVLERLGDDYSLIVKLVPEKDWIASSVKLTFREKSGQNVYSYRVDQFEKIGDVWFPISYQYEHKLPTQTTTLPKGIRVVNGVVEIDQNQTQPPSSISSPAVSAKSEVRLSGVKLGESLESPFEFQSSIPQGMPVSMQDAMHLKYVWFDGHVVPSTDGMPGLFGVQFIKGVASRRWLIWGFTLVIVLFGAYLTRRLARGNS